MTISAVDGDLRSSVESIDTEDVLLPLLVRLGINVDLPVTTVATVTTLGLRPKMWLSTLNM